MVVAVEQIRNSIESGRQCNPRFLKKVKPLNDGQSTSIDTVTKEHRLIPRLYTVEGEEFETYSSEFQEVSLPRSVNEDDCTTEKFYAFTSDVENRIGGEEDCDASWFPFNVTDQEHKVIRIKSDQPILVHGRSGTGKTTCLIYRLWERYQTRRRRQSSKLLRQIFISKNPVFVKRVEKYFNNLSLGSGVTREKVKQTNLKAIESDKFPLFVTAREYFAMLDAATADQTDEADNNASFKSFSRQKSYDEERGITVEELPQESRYDESDWLTEEEFDVEMDETDLDETDNDMEADSETWPSEREVTFTTFKEDIWSKLTKDKPSKEEKTLRPQLVWKEIKSFIKGTWQAVFSKDGYLTKEEYVEEIGKKRAPAFANQRQQIYELSQEYKNQLQKSWQHDECDRVRTLCIRFHTLNGKGSLPISGAVDEIYVDEVQDFTQAEIALLTLSCRRPQNLFLTGDTAQAVTKGISFRFEDLQDLFRTLPLRKQLHPEPAYQLTENYRSHSGILKLAASIIDILEQWFPQYFDHKLPKDEGRFDGPKPVFLELCTPSQMAEVVQTPRKKDKRIEFGAYQAIIVRSGEARRKLPEDLKLGVCLTVFEAKGLEFQDVLLYNFFYNSEATYQDWQYVNSLVEASGKSRKDAEEVMCLHESRGANSRILCSELKQLYTAVTRARRKIWIYDDDTTKRESMASYFRREQLIDEIKKPSNNLEVLSKQFAEPTDESKWKLWGQEFEDDRRWHLASMCYERAGEDAHTKVQFCKAHLMVARWRKSRDRNKRQHELNEPSQIFKSLGMHDLAAKVYCLAGNFIKAAEILDAAGKGDRAIALYKKARDADRKGSTAHNKVTEALLECCKKYNNWELLVVILRDESKFEEAIEEIRRYEKLIAENPEFTEQEVIPPTVPIEDLAFEAACQYHRNDNTDKFIHVVKLLSHKSLQRFIQVMQEKENFRAFGLLQRAGKLSLIEAVKLYYRSGKLEQAVFVSDQYQEKRDREFIAHCKYCLTSRKLFQSKSDTSAIASELINEDELQALANKYSVDNLSDGEIDVNFLLFRLTENTNYLLKVYRLSVKCNNIIGQALSLHRLQRQDVGPLTSVSIMERLRTVQILCEFCETLNHAIGNRKPSEILKLCERELNFLGVYVDNHLLESADVMLWFPSGVEAIHLWELPSAHHLKSKSKRHIPIEIECHKVLSVVIGGLVQLACDIMVGFESTNVEESISVVAGSVVGIIQEIDALVDAMWCPDFMVGANCTHKGHDRSVKKEHSVWVTIRFISELQMLRSWNPEDEKQKLSRQTLDKLEAILEREVKKVINLCFPGLHCKLRGPENRAMIQWARKLDDKSRRTLGYRTTSQAQSFSSIDLFNVWRTHRLAGNKTPREFENWLKKAQITFFRNKAKSGEYHTWLQDELSKSLVQFQSPDPEKGLSKHCFALWLWIEFLEDVYWRQDFTSAFQALFYLVSFELRLDNIEIHPERSDNILMLIETGVAVALLVLSKTGRAVVIPSPFAAGYMVLDAAVSPDLKRLQNRIENSVKQLSVDFNVELWARYFLSLAASGVMQYLDDKETGTTREGSSVCSATSVRRLVIVLTLMCNSDSGSILREKCTTMLSGNMKAWLLERARYSAASREAVRTVTQALACLQLVLSRYQPEQWVYYVDWSPQSRYPLRNLKKPSDYHQFSRFLETHGKQGLQMRFSEELPRLEQLKTINFPFLSALELPQLRESPETQGVPTERQANAYRNTRRQPSTKTQSLPPRFRQNFHDRKTDDSNGQPLETRDLPKARSEFQNTCLETSCNVTLVRSQKDVETKLTNDSSRKERLLTASEQHDKEMSVPIVDNQAHFSKWLQVGPYIIDSSGGEIVSPRTDNHVVFPPDAVSKGDAIQVSYAQYRLDQDWQDNNGCVLDLIQLLPHNVIFHKRVDVFIKHHLIVDESSEIIVMRSTVQDDGTRAWSTIAHLSGSNSKAFVKSDNEDGTLVWLEDNFVGISSKHFCEDCVIVKGRIKLAVQCYQMLSLPKPDSNKFWESLFLSCPSRKRMDSVSESFPGDCRTVLKARRFVSIKTDNDASLDIKVTMYSKGWELKNETKGEIRIEHEDIENHAQNEEPPDEWQLCFEKIRQDACNSSQFEMSISFSGEGVRDKSMTVRGCGSVDEELPHADIAGVSRDETSQNKPLTNQIIRKLYQEVSHEWKPIARLLPGSDGPNGLTDSDIERIVGLRENDDECCYKALTMWQRNHEDKATSEQLIFVLLKVNPALEDVAKKVFSDTLVATCKQKLHDLKN